MDPSLTPSDVHPNSDERDAEATQGTDSFGLLLKRATALAITRRTSEFEEPRDQNRWQNADWLACSSPAAAKSVLEHAVAKESPAVPLRVPSANSLANSVLTFLDGGKAEGPYSTWRHHFYMYLSLFGLHKWWTEDGHHPSDYERLYQIQVIHTFLSFYGPPEDKDVSTMVKGVSIQVRSLDGAHDKLAMAAKEHLPSHLRRKAFDPETESLDDFYETMGELQGLSTE